MTQVSRQQCLIGPYCIPILAASRWNRHVVISSTWALLEIIYPWNGLCSSFFYSIQKKHERDATEGIKMQSIYMSYIYSMYLYRFIYIYCLYRIGRIICFNPKIAPLCSSCPKRGFGPLKHQSSKLPTFLACSRRITFRSLVLQMSGSPRGLMGNGLWLFGTPYFRWLKPAFLGFGEQSDPKKLATKVFLFQAGEAFNFWCNIGNFYQLWEK